MPVLVAAAFSSALLGTGAGSIGATAIVGSLTVGGVFTSALSFGLSFGLQQLLTPKPKKSARTEQVTSRDANPGLIGAYGTVKLGGSTFFLNAQWGAFLWVGLAHCEGPILQYREFWLNDVKTSIPMGSLGGFAGVSPWVANVFLESHLGEADQTVSPQLLAADPSWTAEHRLRGIAYTVQFSKTPPKPEKYFQTVFPNGNPSVRVVLDGYRDILDVRTGVLGWTNNSSLCIRDRMVRPRVDAVTGKTTRFVDPSWISDASFAAFADICDVDVPKADGSTEKRYTLNGTFDWDEEPKETLRRMLATCDAELIMLDDGKIGIRGGVWEEPTVTLTAGMFLDYTYTQGNDSLALFNEARFTFTDPRNDYQQIEGDPWIDPDDDSGITKSTQLEYSMVSSHTQARRLAKIATAKANPRHKLTGCIVKLPALALIGERVVRAPIPILGSEHVWVIDRMEPMGDLSTVSLDLSSISASAYAWNPAAEEGTPPSAPVAPGEEYNAPPVEGMYIELVRTLVSSETGVSLAQIRATADPAGGAVPQYWTLGGQVRPVGGADSEWQEMSVETGGSLLSSPLSDGVEYEVRLHWIGLGVEGAWSSPQSLVVTTDPTPPGMPDGLVANGGAGQASIAWTQPNSPNVSGARVYRASGASTPFSSAVLIRSYNAGPGIARDFVDSGLAAGVWRYWVKAVNGSGVAGDQAGPVNATVT